MSSLIVHHTWPLALGIFVAGGLFVAALPRLYFRKLAHWDSADPPSDAVDAAASEPQQPTLHHAAR